MIGALIGDTFCTEKKQSFTELSIMVVAIAEGMMQGYDKEQDTKAALKTSIHKWRSSYPHFSYQKDRLVMCACIPGWIYFKLPDVENFTAVLAEVLEVNKEDAKAMQLLADSIFFARQDMDKEHICRYIRENKSTVAQEAEKAYTIFTEANGMDEIWELLDNKDNGKRSYMASMAGAMLDACYGVTEEYVQELMHIVDESIGNILLQYRGFLQMQRELHLQAKCCIKRKIIF